MSDGYRGTLSLFADIAYRMAMLNPALGDRVLKTPGVVMIDKIDLHLHSRWQARILEGFVRIFPNVQFIVTRHLPVSWLQCLVTIFAFLTARPRRFLRRRHTDVMRETFSSLF